jgi:hypothetical protein
MLDGFLSVCKLLMRSAPHFFVRSVFSVMLLRALFRVDRVQPPGLCRDILLARLSLTHFAVYEIGCELTLNDFGNKA